MGFEEHNKKEQRLYKLKVRKFAERFFISGYSAVEAARPLYSGKSKHGLEVSASRYLKSAEKFGFIEELRKNMSKEIKLTREMIIKPLVKILEDENCSRKDVINAAKLLTDKFRFYNEDEDAKVDNSQEVGERLIQLMESFKSNMEK